MRGNDLEQIVEGKKTILSSLLFETASHQLPPPKKNHTRTLTQVRRHGQVARPQQEAHERHLRVRGVPAVLRQGLARLRSVLWDGAAEREGPAAEARGDGAGGEDEARGGEARGGQGAAARGQGGDGEGGESGSGGDDQSFGRRRDRLGYFFFLSSRFSFTSSLSNSSKFNFTFVFFL